MSTPSSTFKTSLFTLAVLIAALATSATAQDHSGGQDLLIRVDGLYSVKDELGLFGIVVERREDVAIFKPCHAPAIEIEASRLQPTPFTCDDSASPDTNPTIVDCGDYGGYWTAAGAIDQLDEKGLKDQGIAFTFLPASRTIQAVHMASDEVLARMNAVAVFTNCGNVLTGFDNDGQPVLNVYTETKFDGGLGREEQ